jgi:hypothetical protein
MNTNETKNNQGSPPYFLGILSFIPLIGIFFGVLATIAGLWAWSLGKPRGFKLAMMGIGGICFTLFVVKPFGSP